MDTLLYLLKFVFRLALGLIVAWVAFWLVNLLFPQFKISSILDTKIFKEDWLPPPKNYITSKQPNNGVNGQVYVHGEPYNGYANVYTPNGSVAQPFNQNPPIRSAYVRNLTIYEGGPVRQNTKILGEARQTMFLNGRFPIVIIDATGTIVARTQAISTDMWAVPGWSRFEAYIPPNLPDRVPCKMIFISSQEGVQIPMNIECN